MSKTDLVKGSASYLVSCLISIPYILIKTKDKRTLRFISISNDVPCLSMTSTHSCATVYSDLYFVQMIHINFNLCRFEALHLCINR